MAKTTSAMLAGWLFVCSQAVPSPAQNGPESGSPPKEVTLELIMSDPDWMGSSPEGPFWADDGASVYYSVKRPGEERRDLIQMSLEGEVLRTVADEDRGTVDVAGGRLSSDGRYKVYSRAGDLYFKDLETGELRQLTRTSEAETDPGFLTTQPVGQQISYRRGGRTSATFFVRDLQSGLEHQPFDLRLEEDPDPRKKKDKDKDGGYLKDQQERLFTFVREEKERRHRKWDQDRQEQSADPTRVDRPWYLGKKKEIRRSSLSPSGRWMVLALTPKDRDQGKADQMPRYVNDAGYVAVEEVRTKVGTGREVGHEILLLKRQSHTQTRLDLSVLPAIHDDPLEELRKKAEERRKRVQEAEGGADGEGEKEGTEKEEPAGEDGEKKEEAPKARPVRISHIEWSEDGGRVVVQLFSLDNKDRWIAEIDLEEKRLVPLEHFHDAAWINRRYSNLGWLKDNQTLYFLSEESGYSHLYLRSVVGDAKQPLTRGEFVVSRPELTRDGRYLYFTANREHPGIYETYRVELPKGKLRPEAEAEIEQMTRLGGQSTAVLSPDQSHLLIRHSRTTRPWELYLQEAKPGAQARPLTHTTSPDFLALPWVEPQIVAVPSSHTERPIYARVYTPPGLDLDSARKNPAVLFIHGAGYLQNAHHGWSSYFREFMFHTLLVQRGYVVLDMDYRASAGYGRDWRTAIYRQMGTPEVQDLEDGVAWLVKKRNVDPKRVGTYGGSYGGFLTLMALFQKPGLFAAGAALRPVTDWAHYNHPYTSNILNRPDLDPEAYERSSPIEFAEGLSDPLLICHGMLDDNVFFQDTVRLVQRLIELEKENWETAIYPIEPHGFRTPSSWLDEYRRIFKLFETHLWPAQQGGSPQATAGLR